MLFQLNGRPVRRVEIFGFDAAPVQKHLFVLTETTKKLQVKGAFSWWKSLLKLSLVVLAAYTVGQLLSRSASGIDRSATPAGFRVGIFHGAMMPCAMPSLLIGKDVSIYTQNNNGRPYKLGYTVGVNLCGLAFFGSSFYRISRLKKNLRPAQHAA